MSSVLFVAVCSIVLLLAYRFYAAAFEKFLGVDPARPTPAYTKADGIDYIPAKHWLVLFGHHFSAIAGAGPVIGPVIAVSLWGWGPAALFVLLGTVFMGGVHDMGSLFMSVRRDGKSIADISEEVISRRARLLFSWFVLFALIVVVAVFSYFCGQTFIAEPKIVVPSLGLIPVSILVGILIYLARVRVALSTIIGLGFLVGLVFLGQAVPVALPKAYGMQIWIISLLAYCFFASVLPVNILLQPRDYLSSYVLFFCIAVGFAGIATSRPEFTAPAFTGLDSSEGMLWPMLFVTVACGAISGFHSLVSAGTSSKQIASERDIKRVGYGSMAVEALVAVIAIAACGAGFGSFSMLKDSVASGGPVGTFGAGFGHITRFVLGKYGAFIAVISLNFFILTTLDAATRITRYILQEIFPGLGRYASTMLVVLAAGSIALTGEWKKIWPIFGAANQLIAGLTLIVISSWLLSMKKHVKFTLAPAVFMLITAIGALGWQFGKFVKDGAWFLVSIDIVLAALAIGVVVEVRKWLFTKMAVLRQAQHGSKHGEQSRTIKKEYAKGD